MQPLNVMTSQLVPVNSTASAQLGGDQVHVRRHWAFVYYHDYYGVIIVDVRIFKIHKLEIVYEYMNTGTMT